MVWLMVQATSLITTATSGGAVSNMLVHESKDCTMQQFSQANVQWPDESVFLYKWYSFA
jgi:hypothetical protein